MAHKRKMYILPKGTQPTDEVVSNLITGNIRKRDIARYNKLERYYFGEPYASRPVPHDLRAITNFPLYITNINVGYLLGNPVTYVGGKGVNLDGITDAFDEQAIQNHDIELETDASKFGHGFELDYADEDKNPRTALIDPRNVILVYDDTVMHKKMFAIIYAPTVDEQGRESRTDYDLKIYTKDMVLDRTLSGGSLIKLDGDEDMKHGFGDVPVTEFQNNRDRIGDFEPALSLIDAYNILQSDRVIDRERLLDAILAIYGMSLNDENLKKLKSARVIDRIPVDAKVEYIVKNINEADADVLRKTIAQDIHKITMTPDMTDENFVGNSSGVALSYKILPFEHHTIEKERYFEDGLRERLQLYNSFVTITSGTPKISNKDVDIQFTRSLPQNLLETSEIINNLDGKVPDDTLISLLPFVKDPEEAVKDVRKQKEENFVAFTGGTQNNFGTDNENQSKNDEKDRKTAQNDEN